MAETAAPATIQAVVGENVRRLRDLRGWSQHRLSMASEIHVTVISGIECGRRNITISIVDRLAKAFDAHPSELFQDPR